MWWHRGWGLPWTVQSGPDNGAGRRAGIGLGEWPTSCSSLLGSSPRGGPSSGHWNEETARSRGFLPKEMLLCGDLGGKREAKRCHQRCKKGSFLPPERLPSRFHPDLRFSASFVLISPCSSQPGIWDRQGGEPECSLRISPHPYLSGGRLLASGQAGPSWGGLPPL